MLSRAIWNSIFINYIIIITLVKFIILNFIKYTILHSQIKIKYEAAQ